MTLPSLSQQVILITGASAGIGAALAQVLAQQCSGVRLVLVARRGDRLEAVAEGCRNAGAEVLALPADIAQPQQAKLLVEKTLSVFERIDALVNNAGYGQMGPVELIPTAAVERQFATNVLGPIALIQAVIPVMRRQGGGRIVNISSIGGRLAFPMGGLYSASKFALEGLSDALRMELEPFKIRVSVVEPGPVTTEFFAVARQQGEVAIAHPEATPYRAAFANLENLAQQTASRAWTAEKTARVVLRALSDRHPRPRYIAATGGAVLLFLMTKVLPTRFVDRFWQRFYGIDRVMQEWQSHPRVGDPSG
ncbi:MAG TPA: SDR family oxidoreductase [Synechococcales cyanobacterium M55_K2018_004]|nr:SDR family oxidoreductase [Synechococcales cyanobacterium M55_K2018_004]